MKRWTFLLSLGAVACGPVETPEQPAEPNLVAVEQAVLPPVNDPAPACPIPGPECIERVDAPPAGDPVACPGTRWVGRLPQNLNAAQACPQPSEEDGDGGAWVTAKLFSTDTDLRQGEVAPAIPGELGRYCLYVWSPANPDQPAPPPDLTDNAAIEGMVTRSFWDLDDGTSEAAAAPAVTADNLNASSTFIAQGWDVFPSGTADNQDFEGNNGDVHGVNLWDYYDNNTGRFTASKLRDTLLEHNCMEDQATN